MRKFDETPHEDQHWEKIGISGKWTPVAIESPDIISYNDTVSMIMRIDNMFDPHYPYAGNDEGWRLFCRNYCGVPEEIPMWLTKYHNWETDIHSKVNQCRMKECAKFEKDWGRFPSSLDGTVFEIDLFASSYIGGPHSFVNFKTGKVGLIHNIGKWPESVGNSKKELEWIAKTYPQYKFFVTFCDDEVWGEEYKTVSLCTLMIYDGKITRVTTRQYKDWKYLYKVNHLYGSTCAKKPNFIKRLYWNNTHIWKVFSKLPSWKKFVKWFMENVAQKHFVKMWNNYIMNIDYNFISMKNEKYFGKKYAMAIMDYWLQMLRENKE